MKHHYTLSAGKQGDGVPPFIFCVIMVVAIIETKLLFVQRGACCMSPRPSANAASTAPALQQTMPLRAQVSLCVVIAFALAWLSAFAPGINKFFIVFIVAGVCGTILDIPDDLSFRKILAYCAPIEISFVFGLLMWFAVVGMTEKQGIYFLVGLPLAAYPLLVASCIARPATVQLFSQVYGFIRSSQESGVRLGMFTKIAVTVILTILGVKGTNLIEIAKAVLQ